MKIVGHQLVIRHLTFGKPVCQLLNSWISWLEIGASVLIGATDWRLNRRLQLRLPHRNWIEINYLRRNLFVLAFLNLVLEVNGFLDDFISLKTLLFEPFLLLIDNLVQLRVRKLLLAQLHAQLFYQVVLLLVKLLHRLQLLALGLQLRCEENVLLLLRQQLVREFRDY